MDFEPKPTLCNKYKFVHYEECGNLAYQYSYIKLPYPFKIVKLKSTIILDT